MFKLRVAAAATVIALIGAFASAGSANAASGVGTTETSTSLVDVSLGSAGSLLHLRVLGDDAKATVDPGVGPLSAFSQLFALKATSSVLPVLNNITIPSPPLESRTPGGAGSVTGPVINLANTVPSLPLLGTALASGSLAPVGLTSAITDGVAKSGLGASLADIGLVGGLLSVDAVNSVMGATAGASSAEGFRGLEVGAVSVLNLGALLRGLGIDPSTLPLPEIDGLLDGLNVPVAGLPAGQTLDGFIGGLLPQITQLQTAITGGLSTFGQLTGTLPVNLNSLGLPIPGVATPTAIPDATSLSSILGTAQDLVSGVLDTALGAIDGIDLLKLDGLKIGTVTKAVTATGDSKAEAVGTIGNVSIGNLPVLGGLDLGAALGTVNSLVSTVQSTLDGVLGPLGLDGIISLKLFDKAATNGVTNSSGYTRALAGITGVSLGINPPADLLNVVNGLIGGTAGTNAATDSIGSILNANNGTAGIPVIGGLMSTLNLGSGSGLPAVGGVIGALAGGASVKVASVATGSNFAPQVSGVTPVTQLPRTGANTTAFLVIGMLMIGGVLVGRRFMPVRARIED